MIPSSWHSDTLNASIWHLHMLIIYRVSLQIQEPCMFLELCQAGSELRITMELCKFVGLLALIDQPKVFT